MREKPSIVQRAFIEMHLVIALHDFNNSADDLRDPNHIGHFSIYLSIDNMQRNKPCFILTQSETQLLLD